MTVNERTPREIEDRSSPVRARLVPTQQRSRERYERILQCAVEVMVEKGSEAFRMSDIVERTGVAFGSLYQYFPDKTAVISTLAERYNAIGRECVARDLLTLKSVVHLHPTLCSITGSYYRMFIDNPVMHDIWTATQADRTLQKLDADEGVFLAGLLSDALRPIVSGAPEAALATFSQLMMTLMAATVRHAITLEPTEAQRLLDLFGHILPTDLAAVV